MHWCHALILLKSFNSLKVQKYEINKLLFYIKYILSTIKLIITEG